MQIQYLVENISCGHCTNTIENELSALSAVSAVSADKDSKLVTITIADEDAMTTVEDLLDEIGFAGIRQ